MDETVPQPTETVNRATLSLRETALNHSDLNPRELMRACIGSPDHSRMNPEQTSELIKKMGDTAEKLYKAQGHAADFNALAFQLAYCEAAGPQENISALERRDPQVAADLLTARAIVEGNLPAKALKESYDIALGGFKFPNSPRPTPPGPRV